MVVFCTDIDGPDHRPKTIVVFRSTYSRVRFRSFDFVHPKTTGDSLPDIEMCYFIVRPAAIDLIFSRFSQVQPSMARRHMPAATALALALTCFVVATCFVGPAFVGTALRPIGKRERRKETWETPRLPKVRRTGRSKNVPDGFVWK